MKTENIFILHPENSEQESVLKALAKALNMKFEIAKEKPYNLEFVSKIKRSQEQAKQGKVSAIKTEDLWK